MFGIMQASVAQPDLIVYLQSSTDRLMRLIERRGRSYEQDMDRDYINSLQLLTALALIVLGLFAAG